MKIDVYYNQHMNSNSPAQFLVHKQWCPPHTVDGAREASAASLINKTLMPPMRTLPSLPNHLQKASPPNTIMLEIKF